GENGDSDVPCCRTLPLEKLLLRSGNGVAQNLQVCVSPIRCFVAAAGHGGGRGCQCTYHFNSLNLERGCGNIELLVVGIGSQPRMAKRNPVEDGEMEVVLAG